jgi:ribosomal protein S27E
VPASKLGPPSLENAGTTMGSFVTYQCRHCRYEESGIGIGRGRNPFPYLALYRCARCKTVGSTWIHADRRPRCGVCDDEGVTLFADDATHIDCPKCEKPASFRPAPGSWQ